MEEMSEEGDSPQTEDSQKMPAYKTRSHPHPSGQRVVISQMTSQR